MDRNISGHSSETPGPERADERFEARSGERCRRRWAGPLLVGFAVLGLGGCGATVREAAREAAPTAVDEGVEEMAEPDSRADIARLMQDPNLQQASSDLAGVIAAGMIEGATAPEHAERIAKFSEDLAVQVSSALAKSMSTELGPRVSRIAAESIEQTLDRVLSSGTQQRVTDLTRQLTQAVVQGMTANLNTRAMQMGMTSIDPNAPDGTQTAIAVLARQVGHGAALGFQDAVRQTELRREQGREREGDILALPGALAEIGLGALPWIGLFILIPTAAIIAALIWALVRGRQLRREAQAREDALVLLAGVIKSSEGTPWAADLRERIREAARTTSAGDTLRGVLRKHSGLRLEPAPHDVHSMPAPRSGNLHPAQ